MRDIAMYFNDIQHNFDLENVEKCFDIMYYLKLKLLASRSVLPIPIGLLASLIIFTENAKSSRLLVKRQNALNSSKVML